MTALLDKAINRVARLPVKEQNAIARFLIAELNAEVEWEQSFASSQDELANLAANALAEHQKGKTRKMNLSHDF